MSLTRIHQKLGTAGFIISIVALVAALGGGAYAASGGLTGKQKKEVEKIAKKYAGKQGAAGATGPAGPGGSKGDTGAPGQAGTSGVAGTPGTTVTNKEVQTSETTKCGGHGGAEFKVGTGTATFACNGETGFTEHLPSGKTETGVWSVANAHPAAESVTYVPISFPIPLSIKGEAFLLSKTETDNSATNPDGCTGTIEHPTAPKGKLCIYTAEEALQNAFPGELRFGGLEGEYLPTGTAIQFFANEEPVRILEVNGTWAVTAP